MSLSMSIRGYRNAVRLGMPRFATACLLALVLLSNTLPPTAGAPPDRSAWEATFQNAADLNDAAYVVARDVLLRQGEAIVPLAQRMARNDDWRRWSLAESLLLRIRQSQTVDRWRWALTYWNVRPKFHDDGQVSVTFDATAASFAQKQGLRVPEGETVFGREAVPIVVEAMRECADPAGRGISSGERTFRRALQILKHFADPRTGDPLVYFAATDWRSESEVVEALVKIGKPALPALHRAIRGADQDWPATRRAGVAAKVLGQIGDDTSARVLIDALDQFAWDETIAACCQAIAQLGPKDGPDALLNQLLASAAGWPDRKVGSSSSSNRCYAPIRTSLLAFGPRAR